MTSIRRLLLVPRWVTAALAVLWCAPLLLRPAGGVAALSCAAVAVATTGGGIHKAGATCCCPMDTGHTGKPCCCHKGRTAAERLAFRAVCGAGAAIPAASVLSPNLAWKVATAPAPSIPAPGVRPLSLCPPAGVVDILSCRALSPLGPPPRLLVS